MSNLVINNQVVNVQSIMEDVRKCVEKGFQGLGSFTPDAVMEMLNVIASAPVSANDKEVPSDYLQPMWKGKNRIYEWKNYIPQNQQAVWDTLTNEQRALFAKEANKKAQMESWE